MVLLTPLQREINAILFPLVGNTPPDWNGRSDGAILAIRAELEECLVSEDFASCIENLGIPEINVTWRNWLTLRIRNLLGETFAPALLTNVELADADVFLNEGPCAADDLVCLTTQLASPNAQSLAAYPNMNLALKRKIIAAVNDIVGFEYDGMYLGTALEVPIASGNQAWTSDGVTASDLFVAVPFRYDRQRAANKANELAQAIADGQPTILDQFAGSGTDSARFISVALHAGGIPMTVAPGQTDCDTTSIVSTPLQSWCVKRVDTALEGNRTWLVHNSATDGEGDAINLTQDIRLIGYLLGNQGSLGEGIAYSSTGIFEAFSVEDVIGSPMDLRTDAPSSISTFSNSNQLPTSSPPNLRCIWEYKFFDQNCTGDEQPE